jgi:hypothetical protein
MIHHEPPCKSNAVDAALDGRGALKIYKRMMKGVI